jgi:hypothetical protein
MNEHFAAAGRIGIALCLLMPLVAISLNGQSSTAQVTGKILDPTGGAVPGAQVTVTSIGTGASRDATSGSVGYYTVPLLEPGDYQISVQKAGFRTIRRTGVRLDVNQVARIDFTLELGQLSQAIDVVAAAPTVDAESSTVGTVVGRESVEDLPLNQRNPYQLAFLVPGVSPSTRDISGQTAARYSVIDVFTVNGGRMKTSEFLLDGVFNSASWGYERTSVPAIPPIDSTQEFKIQTDDYTAEFGRSGAGILNMVMKSGTNRFHGELYDFLRNSILDSNDFFANSAAIPLASFQRNLFGGNIGGWIMRDKLFFFSSYEGLRSRQASTLETTVPTSLERTGDFSQTFTPVGTACLPIQIFDPTTTSPSGSGYIRSPFPSNVIPPDRLDAVALNVMPLFPLPNTTGAPCSGVNNFVATDSTAINSDQVDARADWIVNERNTAFVGVNYRTLLEHDPNYYGTLGNTNWAAWHEPSESIRMSYTRVQSPTFLVNVRLGVNRSLQNVPAHSPNFDITSLGFSQTLQQQMTKPLDVPYFGPAGYADIGNNCCQFAFLGGNSFGLAGTATWVRGRQSIKFGTDVRDIQSFEHVGFSTQGIFNFDQGFTQGPNPLVSSLTQGNALASMLLGLGNGYATIIPPLFDSSQYLGFFIQDDLKATSKLTFNLGLRWEIQTGREARGNQLSWFNFGIENPVSNQVTGLGELKGGLQFLGENGMDRQWDNQWHQLAPRVGFAYSINRKTVVRGGYGVFFSPFRGAAGGDYDGYTGFQSTTPWVSSLNGLTPTNYLSNAFPQGLQPPTGSSLGLLTNLGGDFGEGVGGSDVVVNRAMGSGYQQQWSFNIQRELPGRIALEIGYVGSKGTDLAYDNINLNQLSPQNLKLGSALLNLVPNPFYGVVTTVGSPLLEPQVTEAQLLRPHPQFLDMISQPSWGSSSYNALQIRVQKQLSRGLIFLASYANSKWIDQSDGIPNGYGNETFSQNLYNLSADRALSSLDVSQRLVASWVYELPFGNGKAFGGTWPKWVDQVLGHWQWNGIITLETGFPITLSTANNTSNSYSQVLYPNENGDPALPGGRSTNDKLNEWFNTSVFSQPAPFTYGNAPRTLPNVRTDGARNLDLSAFKYFSVGERLKLQLRAEFINAFNTPRFDSPGTVLGTSTFGIVSDDVNNPRQIQMALKLFF